MTKGILVIGITNKNPLRLLVPNYKALRTLYGRRKSLRMAWNYAKQSGAVLNCEIGIDRGVSADVSVSAIYTPETSFTIVSEFKPDGNFDRFINSVIAEYILSQLGDGGENG